MKIEKGKMKGEKLKVLIEDKTVTRHESPFRRMQECIRFSPPLPLPVTGASFQKTPIVGRGILPVFSCLPRFVPDGDSG